MPANSSLWVFRWCTENMPDSFWFTTDGVRDMFWPNPYINPLPMLASAPPQPSAMAACVLQQENERFRRLTT